MRTLFLASISAVLLSACLTTQENPNYEHSSVYRGDSTATTQYASASSNPYASSTHQASTHHASTPSVDISNATFDSATGQYVFSERASTSTASYSQPATYENTPVYAHRAPEIPSLPQSFNPAPSAVVAAPTAYAAAAPAVVSAPSTTAFATAPTDSAFASQEVTGTPGFMALQSQQEPVMAHAELAPALPAAQEVPYARLRAAGTPVPYDHNRNVITADAITTDKQIPDSVRVLQGPSFQGGAQSYIVQPGDTVYSLSRRTCVGVSVIQSMNGIGANYGINIGQSIQLPASVC